MAGVLDHLTLCSLTQLLLSCTVQQYDLAHSTTLNTSVTSSLAVNKALTLMLPLSHPVSLFSLTHASLAGEYRPS